MNAASLINELKRLRNPEQAKVLRGFFKTGPGQYGEGDVFLGIKVPVVRTEIRGYGMLSLGEIAKLLASRFHEVRLAGLLILVRKFEDGKESEKRRIFDFYLSHTDRINNWDLVDLTADRIVGAWLYGKSHTVLTGLARSSDLWKRRIAMIATFHDIKRGESKSALRIAKMLLEDEHDLMHKAVGWMLREVGKRCSQEEEEAFLRSHYRKMPRTMLRYAIERFPEPLRQAYLKGKIS